MPVAVRVADDDSGGEENVVSEACEDVRSLHRKGSELDSMCAQFRKGLGMGRARYRVNGIIS